MLSSSTGMRAARLAAKPNTVCKVISPGIVNPPGRITASPVSALAEGLLDLALGVELPAGSGRGVTVPCPAFGVAVPPPLGVGGTPPLLAASPPCPPVAPTWLWSRDRVTRRELASSGVNIAMMAAVVGHAWTGTGAASW